ncbi:uncharacterized protein BCR38DRAFT_329233 [Pseudomassariella vexata]|uniref:Alpha/Beta hydrolase protein n=1 Tax=Pseudomassariella vexata TaxID=1141098 RepID=A0A1Y2EHU2_9PEZI|nr:uncharacterized protein BCR38DRAFT_329233 [Pseudomassariella vexata]ORY70997.1 hypothetical protein BCR38DRAFT_329233 [Pseudomassariella vexata]
MAAEKKPAVATELAGYTSTSEALPYAISPKRLLWNDFWTLLENATYLPGIIFPVWAGRHEPLNELSSTWCNARSLAFHFILIVFQLGFICSIPLFLFLPTTTSLAYILSFIALNELAVRSFNGPKDKEFVKIPNGGIPIAPGTETERWVFVNGVAVGDHWLQNNLQRLANTFRRRIIGVHNPTLGIIFDVVQCLIERDFNYTVPDIRQGFAYVKQQLMQDDEVVSKVILILHSQGGIEGGMIVDWLLADMPQQKLAKLEIYTFGNAANHFNNPMAKDGKHFLAGRNYFRSIGHIEHYANVGDFVARFGVLNFTTKDKQLGSNDDDEKSENRFVGTVFKRYGTGHMLNQHYLENMFTMKGNEVLESNPFMDSPVVVDEEYLNNNPKHRERLQNGGELTVKSMSRLWLYRNGGTPKEY